MLTMCSIMCNIQYTNIGFSILMCNTANTKYTCYRLFKKHFTPALLQSLMGTLSIACYLLAVYCLLFI